MCGTDLRRSPQWLIDLWWLTILYFIEQILALEKLTHYFIFHQTNSGTGKVSTLHVQWTFVLTWLSIKSRSRIAPFVSFPTYQQTAFYLLRHQKSSKMESEKKIPASRLPACNRLCHFVTGLFVEAAKCGELSFLSGLPTPHSCRELHDAWCTISL